MLESKCPNLGMALITLILEANPAMPPRGKWKNLGDVALEQGTAVVCDGLWHQVSRLRVQVTSPWPSAVSVKRRTLEYQGLTVGSVIFPKFSFSNFLFCSFARLWDAGATGFLLGHVGQ